MGKVVKHNKWY